MINKNSNFDELTEDYIDRFTNLAQSSQFVTQKFFKSLEKNVNHRYKTESKYMNKIDKYRFKKLKKDIVKEFGMWARIKRALGLAPQLCEPSEVASPPLELNSVEKLTEEQVCIEQLKKELQNSKLELEQLQKQLIQQKINQSIGYEEEDLE